MTTDTIHHRQVLSPFLEDKINQLTIEFGRESWQCQSIARQFIYTATEALRDEKLVRQRHYNADLHLAGSQKDGHGAERLYRRTVLLELSTACFAHCRWCLRQNYSRFSLSKSQIIENIKTFGAYPINQHVYEVLITGGDPFTTPTLLDFALDCFRKYAPNIRIVRIGTRIFSTSPASVDDNILSILNKYANCFKIELGTQINSPIEFWPETISAINKVQNIGIVIYNQHPLLKGVNDSLEALTSLYDACRLNSIEPHYLFHCVPIAGMNHHRTSLAKGIELSRALNSGGLISGRAKPKYAAMTDIGKIIITENTFIDKRHTTNEILLRSAYNINQRMTFNPDFTLPNNAIIDENGYMHVWYLDGIDDGYWNNMYV